MKYTEREVLQFVEENDVKFIKLMFATFSERLKVYRSPLRNCRRYSGKDCYLMLQSSVVL